MFVCSSVLCVFGSKTKINIWKYKGQGDLEFLYVCQGYWDVKRTTESKLPATVLQPFTFSWLSSVLQSCGKQRSDNRQVIQLHQNNLEIYGSCLAFIKKEIVCGWRDGNRGRTCCCPVTSSLFDRGCCHSCYCVEALPDMIVIVCYCWQCKTWPESSSLFLCVPPSIHLLTAAHHVFSLSHPADCFRALLVRLYSVSTICCTTSSITPCWRNVQSFAKWKLIFQFPLFYWTIRNKIQKHRLNSVRTEFLKW